MIFLQNVKNFYASQKKKNKKRDYIGTQNKKFIIIFIYQLVIIVLTVCKSKGKLQMPEYLRGNPYTD